jgi:NAD(P)-dependent dehydrogenase (short-subunit alcohol dehydrogenase family)
MDFYAGKRVLIVGGSKGIGRSLAIRLASRRATVCVAARGEESLIDVADELRESFGGRHTHAVLDVADSRSIEAARGRVLDALGGLDVIVCASGSARAAGFLDAPADDFRRMMEINYLGHVNVVRAFAPTLAAQGHGSICLLSSIVAFVPIYGYSAYAASKGAIVAFGESLRQEMKLHGVRVTLFYPPTTDTPGLVEENRTKPGAVWAIESQSGWNRIYSADEVAVSIASAIERGLAHGMVGLDSWILRLGQRFLPGLFRRLADAEVRRAVQAVALRDDGIETRPFGLAVETPADGVPGDPEPAIIRFPETVLSPPASREGPQ